MDPISAADKYHVWYYTEEIWKQTTFLGVLSAKSVCDMWNYQEILAELKPSLVLEFGTNAGGSTLYFAELLGLISPRYRVLTVDIDHSQLADRVRQHRGIELLQADTTSSVVTERFQELRREYPGRAFCILDSDHRKEHVLSELIHIRSVTTAGDYVVVEDGNINGHPVLPEWGPGPYEALQEYYVRFPDDYRVDRSRETKFGFTFAVNGFLIRL
jgi:cephalosporin hydroxylase